MGMNVLMGERGVDDFPGPALYKTYEQAIWTYSSGPMGSCSYVALKPITEILPTIDLFLDFYISGKTCLYSASCPTM